MILSSPGLTGYGDYLDVIVREGGRSSTPRRLGSTMTLAYYWIPAFAGCDAMGL